MNGDLSALEQGKKDMGNTVGNLFNAVTGTAADATSLAKNSLSQSLKISNQAVNTTGDIATSGLMAVSGLGVAGLDTTTHVSKAALGLTTDVGKAGMKTASQTTVGALQLVGDGAKGTFSGVGRIGTLAGKTGKGALERKELRDAEARKRSAANTKYSQEKKTADNQQAIEYKRKTDTEARKARNIIMNKCYDDISEKQPPPVNYPLEKRSKHCQQMANCKIYGKKRNATRFWHKNCSQLKTKMGKRVNDEMWLNTKWDYGWNYSPAMPVAAPAAGGKNTRKKRRTTKRNTRKQRKQRHNKSRKTGSKRTKTTHKKKH